MQDMEPWETAELSYIKDLQQAQFGSHLLDAYFQDKSWPTPGSESDFFPASLSFEHDALDSTLEEEPFLNVPSEAASGVGTPAGTKKHVTVVEAALAMDVRGNLASPPRTPRSPNRLLAPLVCTPGVGEKCSPSKVKKPLILPGMDSVYPEGVQWLELLVPEAKIKRQKDFEARRAAPLWMQSQLEEVDRLAGRRHVRRKPKVPTVQDWKKPPPAPEPEAAAPEESPEVSQAKHTQVQKEWQKFCPFMKFLARPRDEWGTFEENPYEIHTGVMDDDRRPRGLDSQDAGDMRAKTAGMVGSMSNWLSTDEGGSMEHGEPLIMVGDKADWRTLIELGRRYGHPVNEVREIWLEFKEHDQEGVGSITKEEFKKIIRKRTNIDESRELPLHLTKGVSLAGPGRIGFEQFLRWTGLTAWTEEMMAPDPNDRDIRQLAREQEMRLPDAEKIKRLFDEFDTDKSGEIEENEFRHILYRLLRVRNVADVPLKRLQRYWREVDLDGSGSIGFNEFLIWYATTFMQDGRVDL